MAFGKSFGGGPNATSPTPPAASAQAFDARNPFGDFSSEDQGGAGVSDDNSNLPTREEIEARRKAAARDANDDRMKTGTHVAWVDEIVNWPGGVIVKWLSTSYKTCRFEQQCPQGLVDKGADTVAAWTAELLDVYRGLGHPDEGDTRWARRSGQRVPPWDKFWWVPVTTPRGVVAAPIAFELNIDSSYKGFPKIIAARPMGGPRLARMPTTLPRDLAAHLRYPHDHHTIVLRSGAHTGAAIHVAKMDRQDPRLWMGDVELESIEGMLPRKRGT